jgi:hypothetical protein
MGMLYDTASQLQAVPAVSGILRAALLESWALHLRNLIEFCHPSSSKNYPDTVRADWYVQDPTRWASELQPLKADERTTRKTLHQLLAHITYLRDARKSKWTLRQHAIVTRRLALFHAHLSPRRRKWFPRARG